MTAPGEPRTAAGRALLGAIVVGNPAMTTFMRDRILAIEAEAAASGLDVERLGQAIANEDGWIDEDWQEVSDLARSHKRHRAERLIAEYARLAAQEEGA